jgi:hypothetical protein
MRTEVPTAPLNARRGKKSESYKKTTTVINFFSCILTGWGKGSMGQECAIFEVSGWPN